MRFMFPILACALVCCCVAASPAQAARYEAFSPMFVDLEGWSGNTVQGIDMVSSGMTMVSATREYTREDQQLVANLTISGEGVGLEPDAQAFNQTGSFETPEAFVHTTKIGEFLITQTHDKQEKGGGVVVPLATYRGGSGGATFTMSYEGLDAEEALSLAQQFDWQAMQQAVMDNQ